MIDWDGFFNAALQVKHKYLITIRIIIHAQYHCKNNAGYAQNTMSKLICEYPFSAMCV